MSHQAAFPPRRRTPALVALAARASSTPPLIASTVAVGHIALASAQSATCGVHSARWPRAVHAVLFLAVTGANRFSEHALSETRHLAKQPHRPRALIGFCLGSRHRAFSKKSLYAGGAFRDSADVLAAARASSRRSLAECQRAARRVKNLQKP